MHGPGPRRMPLAPAMAFDNRSALIFGHHAWPLEQHIVFRAPPQRAVQENDLDAHPWELITQQDLIGILAGETIWRRPIEAVACARRNEIA